MLESSFTKENSNKHNKKKKTAKREKWFNQPKQDITLFHLGQQDGIGAPALHRVCQEDKEKQYNKQVPMVQHLSLTRQTTGSRVKTATCEAISSKAGITLTVSCVQQWKCGYRLLLPSWHTTGEWCECRGFLPLSCSCSFSLWGW